MRRLLVVAGVLIVVAGVGTAYYVSKHHYGGNVKGTSTEFDPTQTAVPSKPHESSIVSPVFGGVPQHLHVGVGKLRPPFRLVWVSAAPRSSSSARRRVPLPLLRHAGRNLVAVSTRNGLRLWTVHVAAARRPLPPSTGSAAARSTSRSSTGTCGRDAAKRETARSSRSPPVRPTASAGADTSARPSLPRSSSTSGSTSATPRGTCTASRPSTAQPSGRSTPEEP